MFFTLLGCLGILVVTAGIVWIINNTEPTAQKSGASRKSAALVETLVVSEGNYQPILQALGRVEPPQDVQLSARVGGEVVEVAEVFEPGRMVTAGTVLLRLDARDFELDLALRESEVRTAEADLALEAGRRTVAEEEYAFLENEVAADQRSLVLREPQMEAAQARLEAARSQLERAQLNLERTEVKAPFDAHILSRVVSVGSQVSSGEMLGRLVGVDRYWVVLTLPLRDLPWLRLGEQGQPGSKVTLRHRGAWGPDQVREGYLMGLLGELEADTRLARVLAVVEDPLARQQEGPPVILGAMLEARIQGQSIENVVRLSRDYLRAGQTVWLKQEGKLAIRKVSVAYEDEYYAYIREGLAAGDEVVITHLSTVANGIELRRMHEAESFAEEGAMP